MQPEQTIGAAQKDAARKLVSLLGASVRPEELRLALTHRSWAFEQGGVAHNERLEFLGDSVLGIVVTEELYTRFPDATEGDLAKLRASVVNMRALAHVARGLDIGAALLLGKGEVSTGGRDKDSILADATEAIIGAIYLSSGFDSAREFVLGVFRPVIEEAEKRGFNTDWKTKLQELAARKHMTPPRYDVSAEGPDHNRWFTARALLNDRQWGSGEGSSKKIAEQHAAHEAHELIKKTRIPRSDN